MLAILPVEPFTREMAVLAARIDAEMKNVGLVIATADSLIGITALYYGYAIGTRNGRHFKMIPGLQVLSLYAAIDASLMAALNRSGSPAPADRQPNEPTIAATAAHVSRECQGVKDSQPSQPPGVPRAA